MRYISTRQIPLCDIDASDRLRPVDDGLAESFAAIGQKSPIEVVAQIKGRKYRLIAGGHRYAAALACGWESIRAEIKAPVTEHHDLEIRLHEIDENLIRDDLNALDRAVFLGERQRIYEALHPESRNGGTPGNQYTGQKRENDIVSFSQSTAEKLGIGARTIQRATAIFNGLDPSIREKMPVRHSPICRRT